MNSRLITSHNIWLWWEKCKGNVKEQALGFTDFVGIQII